MLNDVDLTTLSSGTSQEQFNSFILTPCKEETQRLCVRSALFCGEHSMKFRFTAVLIVHQLNKCCFNLKTWNHKKWVVRDQILCCSASREPVAQLTRLQCSSLSPWCCIYTLCMFLCPSCVWSVCLPPYRWDHAAGDQAPAGRRHHRAASPSVCLAVRYVTRRRRPAAHRWSYQPRDCDALN